MRTSNKFKQRCRNFVKFCLQNNILTKPDLCERCQTKPAAHGHHDDYMKPLEVKWLCVKCHMQLHGELYRSLNPKPQKPIYNPIPSTYDIDTTALTTADAARVLGISRQRVLQLIAEGVIAATRYGDIWLIAPADLKGLTWDRKPGRRGA